jgi:anti-sigma regulatory factor (Ser/Thr protein kinase)
MTLYLSVVAEPAIVGLLREQASSYLRKWGFAERIDDTVLVVSEYVTNSVKETPGRLIEFELYIVGDLIGIEVYDSSPAHPEERLAAESDESGRGLTIVASLATQWGCRPHATGGKTTWATLPA